VPSSRRVQHSEDLLQLLQQESLAVLNNTVTMEKSAVSFHTLEMKQQSWQFVKKGQPGSIKAWLCISRTKQIVLISFDSKSVI
jgi:hypothetical protein